MTSTPLVSVVTPSYNSARFIEETILSVKNQTYPRIEHIVMDGSSTDETLDILRKYNDSITWISEPDEGQSDAINKGWKMAKGEILGWLNADDIYVPSAVETAVRFFSNNPSTSMVYGNCDFIDENGKIIIRQYQAGKFDLKGLLCSRINIPQPTVFFRKEVLNHVGYLDKDLHMVMDGDYWIRIGLNNLEVQYLPLQLASFRIYHGQKGKDLGYIFGLDQLRIHDKVFNNPTLPDSIRKLKKQAHSAAHLSTCAGYIRRNQRGKALGHLKKAIALYPLHIIKPSQIGLLITATLGVRVSHATTNLKSRVRKQSSSS